MIFLPTIKQFIKTALVPVGHTLYVYGGGWDDEDIKAGQEALTIGEARGWKLFYNTQNSNYNYKNFMKCSSLGLDCTGYIGWTLYNLLNTENNKEGFVFRSDILGEKLAKKGLGWVESAENIEEYLCGDIFFSKKHRHAYICLGECADKSIVLIHSSPPGVMVSGTPTPEGKKGSIAQKTANEFMNKNYPEWIIKFPCSDRGSDYISDYDRFRFYRIIVADPDEITLQSPYHVLNSLK